MNDRSDRTSGVMQRMHAKLEHQRALADIAKRDAKPENTEELTPEQKRARERSRRPQEAKGLSVRVLKTEVVAERARDPEASQRHLPMLRAECLKAERPCPFISCVHHLFLDVSRAGSIKFNFPDLIDEDGAIDFAKMRATCTLDIAAEGGATMERVGRVMNVTRERIRQIEERAARKTRHHGRHLRKDV